MANLKERSVWTFELEQHGVVVASGSGGTKEDMLREGQHYAMMYSQDGPCVLTVKEAPDEIDELE